MSLGDLMQLHKSLSEKYAVKNTKKDRRTSRYISPAFKDNFIQIDRVLDEQDIKYSALPPKEQPIAKQAVQLYIQGNNLDQVCNKLGIPKYRLRKYFRKIQFKIDNFRYFSYPITVVSKWGVPINKTYPSLSACAKDLKVSPQTIAMCIGTKTHLYSGYCLEIYNKPNTRTIEFNSKGKAAYRKYLVKQEYESTGRLPDPVWIKETCGFTSSDSSYRLLKELKKEYRIKDE